MALFRVLFYFCLASLCMYGFEHGLAFGSGGPGS